MHHGPMPADTDPQVVRLQIARWRAMTPGQRARLADELSIDVTRLALSGIRAARPGAADDEIRRELARRRYGEAVARRLDPVPDQG